MVDRQIPLTVCPTSNVVIANLIPDVAAGHRMLTKPAVALLAEPGAAVRVGVRAAAVGTPSAHASG